MDTSADRLLALMQAGDMRALDELARTSGPRLLAVARRACHRRADAEDAVQQALLAAGAGMTRFRGDSPPMHWLATLVTRSCYRLNERLQTEAPSGVRPCGCEEESADEPSDRSFADAVGRALMAVSRTDRLAFLLSVEGFTSVEIAERFGVTHDSVRSRLKRVRKVLRAKLADDTVELAAGTSRHEPHSPAAHR